MRSLTRLSVVLSAIALAACGKPEAPPESATPDVVAPAADAKATPERPVAPDLPESERPSKAECEAMADAVFVMTEKELTDRKVAEAPTILETMRSGREAFVGRCQSKIPRTTVACVRGAKTLMDVKACGPNGAAPPVGERAPDDDHAGHDHAGHDHAAEGPHGDGKAGEKASEADCRAFVEKLDALTAARVPPEARSAQSKPGDSEKAAQQERIIRQCMAEAPASVIRCSLTAANLEGIDKCHEQANLLSQDRPKAPAGTPATQADCEKFLAHFVALNAAGAPPAQAEQMRARMRTNLAAMTQHCVSEVPASVVACGLAARTPADLERCDVAKPGVAPAP